VSLFVCPHCSTATPARTVRTKQRRDHIYRRRQCESCGGRFNTTERASGSVDSTPTIVAAHVGEIIAHAKQLQADLAKA
jgi:transcriptional regulator NrdR family protein